MRGIPMLVLLFVLALVAASCGDDSAATTESEFPTGRFEGEIRAFEFNEDGTFSYFLSPAADDPGLVGTYSVDGDLYTEAIVNYAPCRFPGTCAWTYDGQNLTFHLDGEDDCGARVAAYDGKTFTKS